MGLNQLFNKDIAYAAGSNRSLGGKLIDDGCTALIEEREKRLPTGLGAGAAFTDAGDTQTFSNLENGRGSLDQPGNAAQRFIRMRKFKFRFYSSLSTIQL